jgi:uncharacterized Zn-binding protein involved in type VI secretion
MKDAQGRGIIRLGDKTSHGGQVISAASDFTVLGKAVAVEGDMTYCPQCKGQFAITPAGGTRTHHGKSVAFNDDATECGAKLISSI